MKATFLAAKVGALRETPRKEEAPRRSAVDIAAKVKRKKGDNTVKWGSRILVDERYFAEGMVGRKSSGREKKK